MIRGADGFSILLARVSAMEAARIATRIDAGERLYQDDRHSYEISDRPLVQWPEP